VDAHFDENIAELYRWEIYLFVVSLFSPFIGCGGLYALKLLADAGDIIFLKDIVRPSTIALIFLSSCFHPAMQAHSSLKLKFVSMAVKLPSEYQEGHFKGSAQNWSKSSLDSMDSKDQIQGLQQTVHALQQQMTNFVEEIDRINKINKLLAQEVKKLRNSETTFQADIKEIQKQQTYVSEELERKNNIVETKPQKKRSLFCTIL